MRYRTSHEFGVPLIMVSVMAMLTHWAMQGQPAPVVDERHHRVLLTPALEQMAWFEFGLLVLAWALATGWLLAARHNAVVAMPKRRFEHPVRAGLGWLVPVLGWWDARGIIEHTWRAARIALPYGHPALGRHPARTRLWWVAWAAFTVGTVLVAELPATALHRVVPAWVPVGLLLHALELIALLAWVRIVWAVGQLHEALVHWQRYGYLRRYEPIASLPGSTASLVLVYPPSPLTVR